MNKPKVTKCPMCGTECLVEGKTTFHYKPVRETEIQRLKEQVERLREALEELTNAALADLKPLPSQVEKAFETLKTTKE